MRAILSPPPCNTTNSYRVDPLINIALHNPLNNPLNTQFTLSFVLVVIHHPKGRIFSRFREVSRGAGEKGREAATRGGGSVAWSWGSLVVLVVGGVARSGPYRAPSTSSIKKFRSGHLKLPSTPR